MEDLKKEKGSNFAVIAYHVSDDFIDAQDTSYIRYQYYRPGSVAVPLSIMDGRNQLLGGIPGGNLYSYFLSPYNSAAARIPPVDISISREAPDSVRVEVRNTSSATVRATLHIALVERFRYYPWRDLSTVDFVNRGMMPGPAGQRITLPPAQSFESVQQFSVGNDWNYCSIVAFLQADDKGILQGAMLDLEDSVPEIQIQEGPQTGDLWVKGSDHTLSWSLSRPLARLILEYSKDGGTTWDPIMTVSTVGNTYQWTVPEVNATRCLVAVRDPYGAARSISGLFAIGIKGDFNADGKVDATDRSLLVDYLIENRAAFLPGADLNADGMVDLFDLLYFDSGL
jgi:hypothetical protein